MFENYADRIVLDGVADDEFRARVAAHITTPAGPVRVTGGPGTGKIHTITSAARQAGFSVVVAATPLLEAGAERYVAASIANAANPVVLLVEVDGDTPTNPHVTTLLPALRELATGAKIHTTSVVHTA